MVQIERTQLNIQSSPRVDGKAGQGKTPDQLKVESEQKKELQAKQEAALYNQPGQQNALPGEQKVIEPNLQYNQAKTVVGATRQKQAESKTLVGDIKAKSTVVGEIKQKNTVAGENQPTTVGNANAQNIVVPQAQTNAGPQEVAQNPNVHPVQAGENQQNTPGGNTQVVPQVRVGNRPEVGQVNNAVAQRNERPAQTGGVQQVQPKEATASTENQAVQARQQVKTRETQKLQIKEGVKTQQDQQQNTKVAEQQNTPVSVQTQKGLNVNNLI